MTYQIEGGVYGRGYAYNFHFHLIWVTKYRRQVFTIPEFAWKMKSLLNETASMNDIKVMPDHVHMMISIKPKISAATVVKVLKSRCARVFLESHPGLKAQKFWGGHCGQTVITWERRAR